jgi:hypothetical protein
VNYQLPDDVVSVKYIGYRAKWSSLVRRFLSGRNHSLQDTTHALPQNTQDHKHLRIVEKPVDIQTQYQV